MSRRANPVLRVPAMLLGIVLLATASCGRSTTRITTGSDGLRTFAWRGPPALCTAARATKPVGGQLRGQFGALEPIWLETIEGGRLSVIWPAGFRLEFMGPTFRLLDERGGLAARGAGFVVFPQVDVGSAAGTFHDPYFAAGALFNGCYPP